jgi:hypothetical protein
MPVERSKPSAVDKFLTTEELAERWRVDPATLSNMRYRGEGIPWTKPTGRPLYKLSDVLKAEEEHGHGFSFERLSDALETALELSFKDHAVLMTKLRKLMKVQK